MPTTTCPPTRDQRPVCRGIVGFLLVAIALIYGQTLWFSFLNYDDNVYVYTTPEVRAGLSGAGIVWAFTDGPLGEWYPLSMMSHMLDCQLFGLWSGGHHLVSVLLHAASAIGLFFVLRRMTGQLWPSAFAATLFAIHPQHVESVAWIAERRDVLSGFFFMLTLAAYAAYVHHGQNVRNYLLLASALSLGLMAKPMLVTLPPLLLVLDYWPLGRFGRADDGFHSAPAVQRQPFWWLVVEKLPLFGLALAAGAITLATHAVDDDAVPLAWSTRLANPPVVLVKYLLQFFCPIDLAAYYPFPADGYPTWQVVGALALSAGITIGAVAIRRRCPYLLVGWLWYLGMLAPVLGVISVVSHAMADRYMYLPAVGLAIAVSWSAWRLVANRAPGRRLLGVGAALVIVILTSGAYVQTSYWRDELSLWQHSLDSTEDNYKAEYGMGMALTALDRVDEAIERYRRAIHWQSNRRALNNLGVLLGQRGQPDEEVAQFRKALEVDPNFALAHANLGIALAARGQFDEAERQFRLAIQLDPQLALAEVGLAQMYARQGRSADAIEHYRQARKIDPNQPAVDRALDRLLRSLAPGAR